MMVQGATGLSRIEALPAAGRGSPRADTETAERQAADDAREAARAAQITADVAVVPRQAPIMPAIAAGTFAPGIGDALIQGGRYWLKSPIEINPNRL